MSVFGVFFKILFIFGKRGREGGKGEKRACAREAPIGCLSHAPSQGPGPQPRPVPDQESSWWPCSLWDDTQPTEPDQSGLEGAFICLLLLCLRKGKRFFAAYYRVYFMLRAKKLKSYLIFPAIFLVHVLQFIYYLILLVNENESWFLLLVLLEVLAFLIIRN